ncbi:MAG: MBL fold metallo-hydrolase [Pyrinomonadaceae bacterium]|nr:MBL fold metallo-hydrolase [Pyrinomonadaceae bacterium]MBP9109405.1 MBL fold metallo-hydrolase [Pyrinomonadaceae bacterium]
MKLTVLGSGTSIPHPRRTSSGYWLETSGGTILLDCSASIGSRMAANGLDWPNLDAIWISHFHLDHVGGLAPLLAGTKHAGKMKDRTKPLRIIGPTGLKKLIDAFSDAHNYRLLEQPFPVEIVENEALEPFEIVNGVEATAMKTPHTAESHAIHIRDGDATLVYTADTGFDESLATLANRVDLFILECSFVKDKPAQKHLELSEAIHLIRKAKAKRAMLTHFYPEWDDVDFEEELAKFSPMCEVIEATDGLSIVV